MAGATHEPDAHRCHDSTSPAARSSGSTHQPYTVTWTTANNAADPPTWTVRRRIGAAVGVVVGLCTAIGVGVWQAEPDAYGGSTSGCVTVSLASSTGGIAQHRCGPAAAALCRSVQADQDRVAVLIRTQCRLADIATGAPPMKQR